MQPTLIVVTGRPGAGKTTLAHALARAVRCPLLSRDEVKEGLVHAAGEAAAFGEGRESHATDAFFDAVRVLLEHRVTVVAEAAFQHRVWAPRLEPLLAVARVRVVVCDVAGELARVRRVERGLADPLRGRFHDDRDVRMAAAGEDWRSPPYLVYDPPRLGVPLLTVDTSDGYAPPFEAIVAFARDGAAADESA